MAATTDSGSTGLEVGAGRARPGWLRLGQAMMRRDLRPERLSVLLVAAAATGAMYALALGAMSGDPIFDRLLQRFGSVASLAAALAVLIALFGACSRVASDQRRGWIEPVVTNGQERVAYGLAAVATITALLVVLYLTVLAGAALVAGEWPGPTLGSLATTILRIAAAAAWGAVAGLVLPSPGNGALALVALLFGPFLLIVRYLPQGIEPPRAITWLYAHSLLVVALGNDASVAAIHLLVATSLLVLVSERSVARSR